MFLCDEGAEDRPRDYFFLGEEKASNFRKEERYFRPLVTDINSKLPSHLEVATFSSFKWKNFSSLIEFYFSSEWTFFALWAAVLDYLDEKATKSTPKKGGIFDLRI